MGTDGGNTSDKEILGSSLSGVFVNVSFDVRPLTTLDPFAVSGRGGRNSEIDIREAFFDALCDDVDPRDDAAETTLDFGESLLAMLLRGELVCDVESFPTLRADPLDLLPAFEDALELETDGSKNALSVS